ncbi:MAG: PilN domain-containing protein [Halioglobus sp.]
MLDSKNKWELFGYDMAAIGVHWKRAWYDLLFATDSPLRASFDEVVAAQSESGTRCYQSGVEVQSRQAKCAAIVLPDDIVLLKTLRLPSFAEDNLADALALDVSANSPFAADDTRSGWHVKSRTEQGLEVSLAIVSASAAMKYISSVTGSHDAQAQEAWVMVDDTPLVITGFGESHRESLYTQRLVRASAWIGASALIVLAIFATSAGIKAFEAGRLEAKFAQATESAASASKYRTQLTTANETLTAANEVITQFPNPHKELARLTALLPDDSHLDQFSVRGKELRIRGQADDAASVMQSLTNVEDYVSVTAPQAIRKVSRTNKELFYLDIETQSVIEQ